jgi:prepilin-type processing-associated H-X9-DG protein
VVNTGIWDQRSQGNLDTPANGISHDLFTMYRTPGGAKKGEVTIDYISRNDGLSQTLMLSENADATFWAPRLDGNRMASEADHGMVWFATQDKFLGINQLIDEAPLEGNDPRFARPSSRHSGGVNVIFADGHGIFLNQDIGYEIYGQLMSPAGVDSVHYDVNGTPPYQANLVLQASMYTD